MKERLGRATVQLARTAHATLFDAYARCAYGVTGIEAIVRLLSTTSSSNLGRLLSRYGGRVPEGTVLNAPLYIQNPIGGDFSNLRLEKQCYIGKCVLFDLVAPIELGEQTVLSARVSIFTHADPGDRLLRRFYARKTGPVVIGPGSWIGAGAMILQGINIGTCSVVAAGSVVTADIPSYCVAAGVPARIVKRLCPEGQSLAAERVCRLIDD